MTKAPSWQCKELEGSVIDTYDTTQYRTAAECLVIAPATRPLNAPEHSGPDLDFLCW